MTNTSEPGQPIWKRYRKRTLFMMILASAAGVAAVLSLIVHFAVVRPSVVEVKVAVVAPLSGPQKAMGEQIRRGAALFVDQVNRGGGIGGRPLNLLVFDDGDDPAKAREVAEQAAAAGVVGVVGHWSAGALAAAGEVYRARGVPVLTPAANYSAEDAVNPWLFRTSVDQAFEIRFLANYVRNVVGEKTVSIIYQAGAENEALAQAFDEVMQRFGTKVLYRWDYDGASPLLGDRLKGIAAEIKEKKLIGAFLVLGDAGSSARVLTALRREGISNRVIGPDSLATSAFQQAVKDDWTSGERPMTDRRSAASVASVLNGVLVTTPLLFDTAGELAQGFKNGYQRAHRTNPDWVSAGSFEGMRLLVYAHGKPGRADAVRSIEDTRILVRKRLAALDGDHSIPGHARVDGLFGPVQFNARNVSTHQTMIGVFDGDDMVAALTQLSPIREENVGNYLDELVAGRALYVNDRFMYKTNVVYAGIKMGKIGGLDLSANTVALEFEIWFRWRGAIDPEDLVFTNAVEPVKLDKPEREVKLGDMTYRLYRAKGKFFVNYSSVERAYGTHVIGLAFHHRTLSRNNLMYVSDVLGMDLNSVSTLAEQLLRSNLVFDPGSGSGDASLFQGLTGLLSPGSVVSDPLVQAMTRSRVLAGINGWQLERAWISQDLARRGAEGDPAFVGFGKPQPEFSLLDMGSLLKPDQFDPRDIVPGHWFIFIAIFSLVGSVVSSLLDRQDRGQFWRMQTLGLRILAWPLLLMAAGTLALDYGVVNFSTSTVDTMVTVYSSLWWLIPARLASISMERFIWVPLEIKT
ncbi:MAG: ABC transporter substrate-binding protein, partial [Rhodospirillaceae bacterium]